MSSSINEKNNKNLEGRHNRFNILGIEFQNTVQNQNFIITKGFQLPGQFDGIGQIPLSCRYDVHSFQDQDQEVLQGFIRSFSLQNDHSCSEF